MSEIDYEEVSTKAECVKIGMRHTRDGHVLALAINPDDTPHDLLSDPLGQRYLVVFVRLNDQDEPVASKDTDDGKKAIRLAGTLCSDENFMQYLCSIDEADEMSEMAATVALRRMLNITSRKELAHNKEARSRLLGIRDEFASAMRSGRLIR